MGDMLPGYYNHCGVCGHTASGHHRQVNGKGSGYTGEEHEFLMRDDERMMSSASPVWQDFWRLEDRIASIEEELGRRKKG